MLLEDLSTIKLENISIDGVTMMVSSSGSFSNFSKLWKNENYSRASDIEYYSVIIKNIYI